MLTAAAVLMALAGCSGPESEKVSTPTATPSQPGPFTLAMTPTPGFDTVRVDGTTNLPDGTVVTVSLGRNVKFEGEDSRSFPIGGGGLSVRGG